MSRSFLAALHESSEGSDFEFCGGVNFSVELYGRVRTFVRAPNLTPRSETM
jgi:hypothetical protein